MKYMGSKNRHSKEIIQHFDEYLDGRVFVEPFCGGCNITDKIHVKRLAADVDEDLIILWDAVSKGWTPPKEFTEAQYKNIKHDIPSPLRSYAAYALSFGGKKFGGWCRDSKNTRNYVLEAYNNANKQFPLLHGVEFRCESYEILKCPSDSLIYCDPPYFQTTNYKNNFDHPKFWEWVRIKSQYHKIFVSEYFAPDDFVCIWEKSVASSLTKNTGSKHSIEKLFIRKN